MNHYDNKYDTNIDPLYGLKRGLVEDTMLVQSKSNQIPHMYSISNRIDMTMYSTYSVDPDGCEDADDAFSIYEENEKLFLAIHIADPTEYINIKSSLWEDVGKRIVTRYPSNNPPIHMMPNEIMEKSSLMVNRYGEIKLAITILTEIDKNIYKPVGGTKLLFTKIRVENKNSLSYKKAGENVDKIETLKNGVLISKALYDIRSEKTKGTVLNEVSISFPRYDRESMYLYADTKTEIAMKQMIAEYAIFANTFIGEYLKINFEGAGLYRICNAKEWLNTVYPEITGQELLNEIIINGIQAEYMSTVKPHDLVGAPEYTHFTSPIRRLSDCVCHYLLKYIHLKNTINHLPVPFSNDKLKMYSDDCLKMSRSIKNIQYKDTKFRLIQTMSAMLVTNDSITIRYYVSSYKSRFLNIIINKINEHTVYLSYTLRITDLQTEYTLKEEKQIDVKKVKCIGKFDEGSIPELDKLFIKINK
jgi:exoribonuclease R